jgi:hypothetical protein
MGTKSSAAGFAVIGLLTMGAAGQAWAQDSSAKAADFLQGGRYCFDMSAADRPGSFQHLLLVVEPEKAGEGTALAGVHAIQRGNEGGNEYFNQFTGTATVAPSNDADSDTPTVYVSLMGNGTGLDQDAPTLWAFSFNVVLSPETLSGKVYGAEFESSLIENGQPFTMKGARGVVLDVAPLPCADF